MTIRARLSPFRRRHVCQNLGIWSKQGKTGESSVRRVRRHSRAATIGRDRLAALRTLFSVLPSPNAAIMMIPTRSGPVFAIKHARHKFQLPKSRQRCQRGDDFFVLFGEYSPEVQ